MQWWLPILLMILITPFTPVIDHSASEFFFRDGHFMSNAWVDFLFNYGVLPADFAIILSMIAVILSYYSEKWIKWRKPAFLFLFTMAIGAGLIVHATLKDHWGRPRPKQTIEFGGTQNFRPFYKPNIMNQPEPSKSFSCGHCSAGFCFFAFILAGKRMRNKPLYYSGIVLTLFLGISLSLTRIAQGGHFLSDTLMTAVIMWLTALAGDRLIYKKSEEFAKI
jgi:lipid A 4'-phosphatase